jgi:putative membrane protein
MIVGHSCSCRSIRAPRLAAVAVALLWTVVAAVALTFPALTGRVVDQANVISADARRAVAHRAAMEQFTVRGLARKKERTAILIFVSLAERYARIIADEEISARVPQSQWQAAVDALIAHMRHGRIADGFVAAIDLCGNELAKNFPPAEGNRNHLPDRVYLI